MRLVSFGHGRGWVLPGDISEHCTKELDRLTETRAFSGPQPVSIDRSHLPALNKMWVTEKTDGVRVLLMLCRIQGKSMCVARDRKNQWTLLPAHVKSKQWFQGTVVDGELVFQKMEDGIHYTLCLFDMYSRCGMTIMDQPFSERMKAVEDVSHVLSCESWTCMPKKMLRHVDEVPQHERWKTDGLIWTPERGHVIYKWKPVHTVDFLVWKEGLGDWNVQLFHKGTMRGMDLILLDRHDFLNELWNDSPVPRIVECEPRDLECSVWEVCGIRTDKETPNSYGVYLRTLDSIRSNITLENLRDVYPSRSYPVDPSCSASVTSPGGWQAKPSTSTS